MQLSSTSKEQSLTVVAPVEQLILTPGTPGENVDDEVCSPSEEVNMINAWYNQKHIFVHVVVLKL